MLKTNPIGIAALLALTLSAVTAHAADEWYFYVKNNSSAKIVKLEVSENKRDWGEFDIGSGIAPGRKEKLIWDESTNDEACKQWIRATFDDDSISEPSKFNFCKNLDDPIEFDD